MGGEEEVVVVDGGGVVGAILGLGGGRAGADVFEEEDDAVDWTGEARWRDVSDMFAGGIGEKVTGADIGAGDLAREDMGGYARSRYLSARMLSGSSWINSSN